MISINNGNIFIDGKHTTNPELIGLAMLDFAETIENDGYSIHLKEQDVFIDNVGKCVYEHDDIELKELPERWCIKVDAAVWDYINRKNKSEYPLPGFIAYAYFENLEFNVVINEKMEHAIELSVEDFKRLVINK